MLILYIYIQYFFESTYTRYKKKYYDQKRLQSKYFTKKVEDLNYSKGQLNK